MQISMYLRLYTRYAESWASKRGLRSEKFLRIDTNGCEFNWDLA